MSFWQREKEKDSCPTTTYNISNKTAWYPKEMIFPSSLSAFHLPFIHQSLRWHFMVNVPSFYFHALPLCTTLWQLIYWSYFYQTRKIHLTFYEPQKSSVAPNVVNRSSEKKNTEETQRREEIRATMHDVKVFSNRQTKSLAALAVISFLQRKTQSILVI